MSTARNSESLVFPPVPIFSLPVRGTDDRYPVHAIYCVGRNYAAHAVEMGHDPDKEPPFFFMKSPSTVVSDGRDARYPMATNEVHHEVELVVALGSGGVDIPIGQAMNHVFGYAVGLDMTRRDLQAEAKKLARPWDVAKNFADAAPCGEIAPAADIGHPDAGRIWLEIGGEIRQDGDLAQLLWKVPEVVSQLSRLYELRAGDLIMTGTPSGVGPVAQRDILHGRIDGVGEVKCRIV